MLKRVHSILVVFIFGGAVPVFAQEAVPPVEAAPAAVKAWQYSGTVDTAFSYNPADPAGGANLLRNFDSNANAASLSGATLAARGKSRDFTPKHVTSEMFRAS